MSTRLLHIIKAVSTRASLVVVAAVLSVSGSLFLSQPAYAWGTNNQHSLVPAYFYPDWWNPGNKWYSMCDEMNATSDGSTAIMNPNSGPGTAVNSDYVNVIQYCEEAGQNVIGYVHTSYGQRDIGLVKDEIDAYYSWYTGDDWGIDGIFLDEMSNDSATLSYYEELYEYIHDVGGVYADDVVGNPGIGATTDWQLDTPVVDELVIFEGTASTYLNWTPPSWVSNYPASDFSHLIYDAADSTVMAQVCNASKNVKAGWIYVTDDVLPNPWDTLPPYWNDLTPTC